MPTSRDQALREQGDKQRSSLAQVTEETSSADGLRKRNALTDVKCTATHGLGTGRDKLVFLLQESTGNKSDADATIAMNGDVAVTFAASQGANTIRVTFIR